MLLGLDPSRTTIGPVDGAAGVVAVACRPIGSAAGLPARRPTVFRLQVFTRFFDRRELAPADLASAVGLRRCHRHRDQAARRLFVRSFGPVRASR